MGVFKSGIGGGIGVPIGAGVELASNSGVGVGVTVGGLIVGGIIVRVIEGLVGNVLGVLVGEGVVVALPLPGTDVGVGGLIAGVRLVGNGVRLGSVVGVKLPGVVSVETIAGLVGVCAGKLVSVGVGGVVRFSTGTRSMPTNRLGGTSTGWNRV